MSETGAFEAANHQYQDVSLKKYLGGRLRMGNWRAISKTPRARALYVISLAMALLGHDLLGNGQTLFSISSIPLAT